MDSYIRYGERIISRNHFDGYLLFFEVIECGSWISHADQYVDASKLSEEEYEAAVEKYTVFGRVKPEQKKIFVQLLKRNNTVAMTGDGVNDILAMKEADCSIACEIPAWTATLDTVSGLSPEITLMATCCFLK